MEVNTLKNKQVHEKLVEVTEKWDLWGFAGSGLPRIELDGDRHFTIEPHNGILEYSPNIIKLTAGDMIVVITGMELEISSMDKGSLALKGRISSVELTR